MSVIQIQGGRPLSGSVRIQGAKNSVLPLLAGEPGTFRPGALGHKEAETPPHKAWRPNTPSQEEEQPPPTGTGPGRSWSGGRR